MISYDALNRLQSATDPAGRATNYRYDLTPGMIGTLSDRTLPNGLITSYSYDTLYRLTGVTHRVGIQAPLLSYTYTLGPAGDRQEVVEADGTRTTWGYDNAYRLTSETIRTSGGSVLYQASYGYDRVGNRTSQTINGQSRTLAYNSLDQLLSDGASTYQYDGRGNLTQITTGASVTQYTWNGADRLARVILPGGATINHVYDADGRRVQQTAGGTITNYLWDETALYGDMVRESNATGGTIASYVFANGDPISTQRGSARLYHVLDAQGNVRALSSQAVPPAAPSITDRYSYTAFGETRSQTGSSVQPYRYTGQQLDAQTGVYYLRARSYAPGWDGSSAATRSQGWPRCR